MKILSPLLALILASVSFTTGRVAGADRTDTPSRVERSALAPRQEVLKASHATATLVVYPVATARGAQHATATRVAEAISLAGWFKSSTAPTDVMPVKLPRPGMNELKMLWGFAHAFQTELKARPPEADYALAVDYGFNPQKWQQGYAHFVLCDRQGNWVIVDLQNSHHREYQSHKPVSAADCERLILRRLEAYLAAPPSKPAS